MFSYALLLLFRPGEHCSFFSRSFFKNPMKIFATVLALCAVVCFCISPAHARRGNPYNFGGISRGNIKFQYYLIDSDDDGTDTRQPKANAFVDTLYDASRWHRIAGPPKDTHKVVN